MLLLEHAESADGSGERLICFTVRGFRCDLPTAHPAELLAALAPAPNDASLAAVLRRWSLALATADAAPLVGGFRWDPSRDPAALAVDAAELRALDATIRGFQDKARREK
ncbi:hypothetical protein [Phycisphaera mikurensis]|uniref:Uncharacterized protein n=1 Tax=Phycisphaera mikurensis (strain NBRC 102666 / KCTC 22515 / FYK2301M01) TaxID=1142394 RepID=I0IF59_PHYMF|nr:hypothetical protein [Phycisphaera mikurensis]MBB6440707.1 hypothetical protein [Phycisphaera mikurensis]BAM03897.1 hypothetical protein PSMK_17380 [Phycisphaera mikurensis NBRC 102666]